MPRHKGFYTDYTNLNKSASAWGTKHSSTSDTNVTWVTYTQQPLMIMSTIMKVAICNAHAYTCIIITYYIVTLQYNIAGYLLRIKLLGV